MKNWLDITDFNKYNTEKWETRLLAKHTHTQPMQRENEKISSGC